MGWPNLKTRYRRSASFGKRRTEHTKRSRRLQSAETDKQQLSPNWTSMTLASFDDAKTRRREFFQRFHLGLPDEGADPEERHARFTSRQQDISIDM